MQRTTLMTVPTIQLTEMKGAGAGVGVSNQYGEFINSLKEMDYHDDFIVLEKVLEFIQNFILACPHIDNSELLEYLVNEIIKNHILSGKIISNENGKLIYQMMINEDLVRLVLEASTLNIETLQIIGDAEANVPNPTYEDYLDYLISIQVPSNLANDNDTSFDVLSPRDFHPVEVPIQGEMMIGPGFDSRNNNDDDEWFLSSPAPPSTPSSKGNEDSLEVSPASDDAERNSENPTLRAGFFKEVGAGHSEIPIVVAHTQSVRANAAASPIADDLSPGSKALFKGEMIWEREFEQEDNEAAGNTLSRSVSV